VAVNTPRTTVLADPWGGAFAVAEAVYMGVIDAFDAVAAVWTHAAIAHWVAVGFEVFAGVA
jgi:hypothetical protein